MSEPARKRAVRVPFRRIGPGNVVLFLVSLALVVVVGVAVKGVTHDADVKSCARANAVRDESNRRIAAHEADKESLLKLANAITATRHLEAKVFRRFEEQSKQQIPLLQSDPATRKFVAQARAGEKLIHKLRLRYQAAGRVDAAIAKTEAKVTFHAIPLVDCKKAVP